MDARSENILAWMGLSGDSEEVAAEKLATRVTITAAQTAVARLIAKDLTDLLGRSLVIASDGSCDIELAVGTDYETDAPLKLSVAMTADFARLPYDLLERMAGRIIGEVRGIGMFWAVEVVKDRATKEPVDNATVQGVVDGCKALGALGMAASHVMPQAIRVGNEGDRNICHRRCGGWGLCLRTRPGIRSV